jgi:hypothetical protein
MLGLIFSEQKVGDNPGTAKNNGYNIVKGNGLHGATDERRIRKPMLYRPARASMWQVVEFFASVGLSMEVDAVLIMSA